MKVFFFILEIEKLRKLVQEIVNNMNEENIEKYIDKIKDDPKIKSDLYFNDYFPAFKKTEDYLISIQMNNYNKFTDEMNNTVKHVNESKDELFKQIISMKTKLLNNNLNYDKYDV
jgi:hypothetical protein